MAIDNDFSEAIKLVQADRGITEELVRSTIRESLLAAYKKTYGTADNAVVEFSETGDDVTIYAKKTIVEDDDLYAPVSEIELSEALELNEDCEVGDELLIEINPKQFDRSAIQSAKQKTRQDLREIQKDTLYSEFKDKVGEMIIGYYQRERDGTIYVDLGKTEGLLPRRFQSPREEYHREDRIKAMIAEVKKTPTGLEIILSRSHGEFVKRIFELEVPEVYDGTVKIFKIVREPGQRTKVAVYSTRDDVDPVGACVGMKGVRIQAIVRELEGERIDILKYDSDPLTFIRNALSPAGVQDVIMLDASKRQALAIVPEQQLSLAIGKQGLNVRLANRLVDWNIDVKTEEQVQNMDISQEANRAVSHLFSGISGPEEEITRIRELPEIPDRLVSLLNENGIELIESLINLSTEELEALTGITSADIEHIQKIIENNVEIIENLEEGKIDEELPKDEKSEEIDEDKNQLEALEEIDEDKNQLEDLEEIDEDKNQLEDSEEIDEDKNQLEDDETTPIACPECEKPITIEMSACPHCGVGLSFEIEEVEEQE